MKIRCLLCNGKIENTFQAKWKHMLRRHPEETFSRLLPMAVNVDQVRSAGFQAGQSLRDNILSRFRGA